MNDNKINFRTPRTVAGTVMEAVVGVLLLAMWVLIIYLSVNAPSDATRTMIILGIQGTVLVPLMMVLCYFPKTFNIPKRNPRVEHYLLTIHLVRVVSIFVILMMIASVWKEGRPADTKAMEGVLTALGCAMTLTVIYYIVRLIRMK